LRSLLRTVTTAAIFLCALTLARPAALAAQNVNAAITDLSDPSAAALAAGSAAVSHLSVDQIVQRLADGEKKRAEDLKGYTELRTYSVSYHGFPANLNSTMVVAVTYSAPANKQFHIVSQTGSKMLADHVLKKLLEAEKESTADPRQTAPTAANYDFTLVGQQILDGRPCYLLRVQPRTNSRLLYRGTIWVDADDFAVAKIEAEPAHNPSIWIRDTKIHHVNAKTGEFWLPEHNESDTDVRFGGRATLTIDYGVYKMDSPASQADLQPLSGSLPSGK
jgi:outer membrane lipoprotein-sorting protein